MTFHEQLQRAESLARTNGALVIEPVKQPVEPKHVARIEAGYGMDRYQDRGLVVTRDAVFNARLPWGA